MSRRRLRFLQLSALAGSLALPIATPANAAEVTFERLANADREPQNWLMNHRTYDAQRYSPLARINRSNVKNLRLAYAVALGSTSAKDALGPHQETVSIPRWWQQFLVSIIQPENATALHSVALHVR